MRKQLLVEMLSRGNTETMLCQHRASCFGAGFHVVSDRAIDQHVAELEWLDELGVRLHGVGGVESKADHVECQPFVQVDVRHDPEDGHDRNRPGQELVDEVPDVPTLADGELDGAISS